MAKLFYYYSSMNAGKSTILLQSSYNYKERGMETLLFTPSIDTRYGKGKITSRIGLDSDAIVIEQDFDIFRYVSDYLKSHQKLACVLVDEVHFLVKHQIHELCRIVDELGLPVLTYGIRSDFRAEPFEGSLYLLAWADELIEVKTICHCGRKATMNMRVDANGKKVQEGDQVQIGGNDLYVSTCRAHFYKGLSGINPHKEHANLQDTCPSITS